jgi:hypothetical protein
VRVLYDRVAAIDVHKDMIKVAVRVPGKKRGTARPMCWSTAACTKACKPWKPTSAPGSRTGTKTRGHSPGPRPQKRSWTHWQNI